MSIGEAKNNANSTSFFYRDDELLNAADYLHNVLRLVVVEPVILWFGGSLGDTDLQRLLKKIEALQANGFLQIEWYSPKSGHTARSLIICLGGKIKSAVLSITSTGSDLTGIPAVKTVFEATLPEKEVVGSFFFQSSEKVTFLDPMPEINLNVGSDDLRDLVNAE